ncbi:MAG: serine protease [Clostridia bacterium]|nr:serine protease [Clostridia bacterium]
MEDKNFETTKEQEIGVETEPQVETVCEQPEISDMDSTAENEQVVQNTVSSDQEPTYKPTESVSNPYNAIVYTPVVTPKEPRKVNKGLRVFLCLVAVVMSVCILLTVGYIAGRNQTVSPKNDAPVGVVSKPEGSTLTAAEIYNNVSQSVVGIVIYNASGEKGTASGVVFKDGYIITNDHIYTDVPNAKFLIVDAKGKEYDAYYVAGDTRTDIAVLRTDAKLTLATFCDSNEVVVGEDAIAIGYPAGAYEKPIFTMGTISSNSRRVTGTTSYSTKMIQTDSAINPGSSGGALVNAYGQVIGITSSKIAGTYYDSIGYAIPSNSAVDIANKLIEHGYVKGRAILGISYTENTVVVEKLDPNKKAGLVIEAITEGGPMENKGVIIGEIITEVNGTRVTRGEIILDVIENLKSGDNITITVYNPDTKQSRNITATLGEDKGSSSYVITGNSDTTEIK